MFKNKKIFILAFALFTLVSASILGNTKVLTAANGEASLTVSGDKIKVGQDFNIEVRVNGINDIHGASLDLNFDNSLISVQEILPGSLFYGLTEGKNYSHFRSLNELSTGKLSTAILLTGIDNGISAEGSLFIIKCRALKEGNLNFKPNVNYTLKLANSKKTLDNKITAFAAKETTIPVIIKDQETIVKEKLEQVNPRIVYAGTWSNHWDPKNSDSSAKFTNDKDGAFSFSFEGTGFRWYGLANSFKGKAKVTIDGKAETIDTYSATEQYQKLFYEKKDLPNTKHDVKIEVGTEYINIDFLEILSIKDNSSSPTIPNTPPPTETQPPVPDKPPVSEVITTIKKIEQTDVNFQYTGDWLNHWDNRNSGGSAKYTNSDNASIQFTFDGTGFKWYGLANKYKGKAKVTIDGKQEEIDTYSTSEQYQKLFFTKDGLANCKHTVKIETYTDYINIDYLEIIQQTVLNPSSGDQQSTNPLTGKWTRFEENDSKIKYSGSWLIHNLDSNSGGSAKYTNFSEASTEFSFTGTGFRWYGNANKFKGPVTVTIDGKSERVNTYFDGQQYQKLFYEKKGLSYDTHKVQLTLVNDYISIDCFEIENGSIN